MSNAYPLLAKVPELGEVTSTERRTGDPPRYDKMSEVEDVFGEAYACLEQGLIYDEEASMRSAALTMYERGLALLHEGEQMEGARASEMYAYLKEAEGSCKARCNVLRIEGAAVRETPTGEKAGIAGESRSSSLSHAIEGVADAELIFCIPEGVQLFQIDSQTATAPTYPAALLIFSFPERAGTSSSADFVGLRPDAFIQVGPWSYPLYRGQTPILRNEFGAYVVANPTPDAPELTVAILIPTDLDEELRKRLHDVLKEYSVVREEAEVEGATEAPPLTAEEKRRVSERLAKFLIRSGEKVAWAVQSGSVKGASFLHSKSERYRTGPQTDKPTQVAGGIKTGAIYMHKGSKVVARCTRYLLDKIGDIGIAVGRQVASGAKSTFGEGKGGGVVNGTITVLGGGITGVATVWIALEDASKTLGRSIADQTVDVVKVKYGDEAAETTRHALYGAGHGTLAAAQLWDLGPRSIAGRMARKAGIQVVRDLDSSRKYEAKEKKPPVPPAPSSTSSMEKDPKDSKGEKKNK